MTCIQRRHSCASVRLPVEGLLIRTRDYSDVTVIDADGRRIPWPEVSHFDDDAMHGLMRQIVHCLYTLQVKAGILISRRSWRAGRRFPGAGIPQSRIRVS